MSKLIVEMEMPKDLAVIVTILPDGRIFKHLGYKDKKQIGKIVGELPDEHGDLIDRDALRKYGMEYRGCIDEDGLIYVPLRDVTKSILNAPTVIAAERKEE